MTDPTRKASPTAPRRLPAHLAVELHDSRLLGIRREEAGLVLELDVYLHASDGEIWSDATSGWTQAAELWLEGGTVVEAPVALPLWILDGAVTVAGERYDNTFALPFERNKPSRVELSGGEGRLLATACGVRLTLLGEPQFVEEVPAE